MQLAVFILVYPLLWLVSRLPFRVLYLLSDLLYPLIYHIIGYRKKVVRKNLELVFPKKNVAERLRIEKKFFRHMCDMFLEMIKTMGMTAEQMDERFKMSNEGIINNYAERNRSTVLFAGHYASWEWLLALNRSLKPNAYGIYQKIENRYFDKLIKDIRGKFGTTLIRTNKSRELIAEMINKGENFVLGIASDQSPMLHRARHWSKFMGIKVPIHVGGEELCKQHDLVPIFLQVKKIKRGYYEAHFELITEHAKEAPNYTIAETFMKKLEKSIHDAPEFYLWTHKRWKHRNKVPKEFS